MLTATEVGPEGRGRTATFHSRTAFRPEEEEAVGLPRGMLLDDDTFRVNAVGLDHKIPCWDSRSRRRPTSTSERARSRIRVWWCEGAAVRDLHLPLGTLRDRLVTTTPGQKIAYVVDVAYHPANARAIVDLLRGADLLFIEAAFLEKNSRTAGQRGHLTAHQAGRLAREAAAKRMVPMHFSPRYVGQEERLRREAQEAFVSDDLTGATPPASERSPTPGAATPP